MSDPLVDVIGPDGTHLYWSTHCRHGNHEACAATTINGGPRRPAQCKTCAAPCRCDCHAGGDHARPSTPTESAAELSTSAAEAPDRPGPLPL